MFEYILRRLVLVAFIVMSLIFTWSLFGPTDYHYTRYHDVYIISEKSEMVRNKSCDTGSHDHYMLPKIIVEWKGINNSTGEIEKFTTEFDDKDDSNDGLSYADLHNGVAKIHNCAKSICTWFGWLGLLILFIGTYLAEDLDHDYYSSEKKDINELRICIWAILSSFCGYNDEIITKVANHYNNTFLYNKVIRYSELHNKYNEFRKFSKLDIKPSKNNQDEI